MKKQRVAVIFIAVFMLLILGVVSFGYISTFVLPPRKLVVRVDDTRYTMGDMIKILRMMQLGSEFFGQRMDLSTVPFQIPLSLAQNEIIARNAPRYSLQVTDAEIDQEIRSRLLPAPDPSQQVPQEQLDKEFKERYKQYINAIRLSEKEYRTVVKADIFRTKMTEVIGQDIPKIAPQVHVFGISLGQSSANYNILKTKFKDGTPWAQLVKEFNQDATLAQQKGDVGWFPQGIDPTLDELFFNTLKVGEISEALTESGGGQNNTVVYMVSEKVDARPIDDNNMQALKNKALQSWLDDQWDKFDIETHFTSDDYAWVAKQLGISSILPTPQANSQSPIR